MQIRIEASNFPTGRGNVRVGVQRRNKPDELLDPFSGDAPTTVWTLDCAVRAGSIPPDVIGDHIQGGPGGRFVYLSWSELVGDGWTMFRRAKLMLADVADEVLTEAVRCGLLVGRVGLTDDQGQPVCARLRPPAIRWSTS